MGRREYCIIINDIIKLILYGDVSDDGLAHDA
jgi:hypothetical protein